MKHNDYWRGRFEQLNESLLRQGVGYYDELERSYRLATQNIEKDIAVWYQRLAANNGISFVEAKKLLSVGELKEFRWTVEEYIKRGKENGIDQRWTKQLENASAKVHISRLEALKMQTQQHLEVLYGNHLDGMDKAMRGVYEAGYYRTAFEVQRGLNVGYSFQQLDDEKLQKIISKPWAADGKNFSDRIWQDKTKMINAMHTELTQATIRGDPPGRTVKTISDKLQVSRGNAGRLVMTESAFFASASQRDCFTALDVEEYEIIATLDRRTSTICRDMDGKVFKQSDYKPGITAPPFHCWCRSCTAPYFADEKGSRAARDEDGKTYYVPSDMKYEEWQKNNTFREAYNKSGKDIKKFAQELLNAEQLPFVIQHHPIHAFGQCRLNIDNVEMKILSYELNNQDSRPIEYQVKTAFHELFHAKSNGLKQDVNLISLKEWAYIDDVFAEVTAHYLAKSVGITKEIAPSYSQYLVEVLPVLKTLPNFAQCNSIADFGKVAYQFRFGDKLNAEWKALHDYLKTQNHDIINYGKQYLNYIADNRDALIDKMLENMPAYINYRENMLNDVGELVENIKNGHSLTKNQTLVYTNVLIIAMNRQGVT